jgi:L-glutamine-phosphate cytidylyltransferase
MKAIILAAGVGKRLQHHFKGLPKCLIPIGGRPLLLRSLSSLEKLGIMERVIVVGYEKEKIERSVRGDLTLIGTTRFRVNPDYRKGSILSLWSARGEFNDDLLVMDADVLFPDALLSRLVDSSQPNAFLLDPRSSSAGEEMMLMVKGNRVVHIGRKVAEPYDVIGEGVGFLKLSRKDAPLLLQSVEQLILEGKNFNEYEEALDLFLQRAIVGYESVGTFAWTEIDFLEDVERAEKEILPRLE